MRENLLPSFYEKLQLFRKGKWSPALPGSRKDEYGQWWHFKVGYKTPNALRGTEPYTLCGKTSRQTYATTRKDSVSCRRCLALLKDDNWFCEDHGFISDENVTYEECCAICGRSVVVDTINAHHGDG